MTKTLKSRRRASTWIALGLCALSLCAPSPAFADPSCTAFLDRARKIAAASPRNDVQVMWTTNYFVPNRDARFMGTTQVTLKKQGADLFGAASRDQIVVSLDPAKPAAKRTDKVSLRVRQDGKLMFNDTFGPFDPSCTHGKFAVVNGGDSIEVFSLHPRVIVEPGDSAQISGATARINTSGGGGASSTTGVTGIYTCGCSGTGNCKVEIQNKVLACSAGVLGCKDGCTLTTTTTGAAPAIQ